MFVMACICHSSLHMPGILSTPTYDIPILPEACWITPQWSTHKPGDGITMWSCHHTRTVCIHHTLVPGWWIIYRYIFPCWYFMIFFFHLLWKTIKAINNCAGLQITWPNTKKQQIKCACGFTSITTNHALHECVAVLDGYHLQTITPLKKKYIMCSHTFLVITKPTG